MNKLQKKLIKQACRKFSSITPCGTKKCFTDCFVFNNDEVQFWFNTPGDSTHIIVEKINTTDQNPNSIGSNVPINNTTQNDLSHKQSHRDLEKPQ